MIRLEAEGIIGLVWVLADKKKKYISNLVEIQKEKSREIIDFIGFRTHLRGEKIALEHAMKQRKQPFVGKVFQKSKFNISIPMKGKNKNHRRSIRLCKIAYSFYFFCEC